METGTSEPPKDCHRRVKSSPLSPTHTHTKLLSA